MKKKEKEIDTVDATGAIEETPATEPVLDETALIKEELSELTTKLQQQIELNAELRTQLQGAAQRNNTLAKRNLDEAMLSSYNADGDKVTIKFDFRPASPHIRVSIAEYTKELSTLTNKILAKYEVKDFAQKTQMEFNGQDNIDYAEMQTEMITGLSELNINMLKKLIDDSQNVTDEKTLLRSGHGSEFWQNVDIEEVERLISSFRLVHYV